MYEYMQNPDVHISVTLILPWYLVLNPRFLRTAKAVEAEPWCLHKAAAYLRAFVES